MPRSEKNPCLLVTGGVGYVGTTFVREALLAGFRVRCLDLLLYGARPVLGLMNHPRFELVKGDIRDRKLVRSCTEGVSRIVHLAAIVGDRPCESAPRASFQINFQGTCILAEEAIRAGVERFVFASTCSNYGISETSVPADENRTLNPVSLYAELKIDCEQFLLALEAAKTSITILRFATAFGLSARTRFDLLVNSLVYEAVNNKEIVVFAPRTWRPYIHVFDMSGIILKVLAAHKEKVAGKIFNAGTDELNYEKRDVVEMIRERLPRLVVKYVNTIDDKRTYRVDFSKLKKTLNFKAEYSVRDGIDELVTSFEKGILTSADFESNNLDQIESFYRDREKSLTID